MPEEEKKKQRSIEVDLGYNPQEVTKARTTAFNPNQQPTNTKGYNPEKVTEVRTTIYPDKPTLKEGYNPTEVTKARSKEKDK